MSTEKKLDGGSASKGQGEDEDSSFENEEGSSIENELIDQENAISHLGSNPHSESKIETGRGSINISEDLLLNVNLKEGVEMLPDNFVQNKKKSIEGDVQKIPLKQTSEEIKDTLKNNPIKNTVNAYVENPAITRLKNKKVVKKKKKKIEIENENETQQVEENADGENPKSRKQKVVKKKVTKKSSTPNYLFDQLVLDDDPIEEEIMINEYVGAEVDKIWKAITVSKPLSNKLVGTEEQFKRMGTDKAGAEVLISKGKERIFQECYADVRLKIEQMRKTSQIKSGSTNKEKSTFLSN